MSTMIILISIMLFLAFLNIVISVCEYIGERRFRRLAERLLTRIVLKCHCEGHICMPACEDDKVYDLELGCEMYEFEEIRDDNMQRRIYVSKDGAHVKALPWRNLDNIVEDYDRGEPDEAD